MAFFPPISSLPSELLAMIIWFATGPYVHRGDPDLGQTCTLFKLGSICSAWYHATRSSPELWTTLALTPKQEGPTRTTDYISLLRYYYERLGSAALEVSLWYDRDDDTFEEILKVILCEHPSRLKYLSFLLQGDKEWSLLLQYARRESLVFCELEGLEFSRMSGVRERFNVFCNSPHFRTLTLRNDVNNIPIQFPWAQLTTVHLLDTTYETAYYCLMQCSQLHEFSWTGPPFRHFKQIHKFDIEGRTITLPSLRRLRWITSRNIDHRLLNHFRFPSLTGLEWKMTLPSHDTPVHDFFSSMEDLRELLFVDTRWTYNIGDYLHHFRRLVTLELKLAMDSSQSRLVAEE